MSKVSYWIRNIALILVVVVLAFLSVVKLMKIQIVDGSTYVASSEKNYTASQSIQAARGQIVDRNGVVLNTNKIVYKVIIQKAFFTTGEENRIIAQTVSILKKHNEEWIDSLPISMTSPYVFNETDDAKLDSFKSNIGVNVDATVENCIVSMNEKFKISDSYDEQMKRYIAGVRYEMMIRDFSYENRYTLAEDISLETVIALKESSFVLDGIDIIEEPMRVYNRGTIAPHVRGTIGKISSDDYEALKTEGYSLNDTIGTSGIEKAMESVLRGENGVRTIVRDSSGMAVSDEVTKSVQTGSSVKLTIDSKFQNTLQTILENQINWLHFMNDPNRGNECDAGSVVVLDAKTGGVLAMANYPNYDLQEYVDDYSAVLNADGNPLYNRAINGQYRPGSTFKTITATAGLVSGLIDKSSIVVCNGVYTFYQDFHPKCTGSHGAIDVVHALKVSCNSFFYDVGRRLGIESLSDYAALFGVGTDLELEIGGASGRMTTPDIYEQLIGEEWTAGNTIQAAIGQSETLLTPLHLAVQALTLANNGTRYKPYLVKSVMDYDCTETLYETEPEKVSQIDEGETNAFSIVREGMIEVSKNCVWPVYDMSKWTFDYLPYGVAIKTGTPEAGGGYYNSTVLGYYPAEDPVIAFGVVLEKGEFSRYMIRNIIDAYFYDCYEPDADEDGNIISPWKRWTEERTAIR